MPIYSISQIKQWFRTNLKPTEPQFWAWLDSFWHKNEKIPASSIDTLQELLDAKVDKKDIKPQSTVYVPGQSYVYDANNEKYVSYRNEASSDTQFSKEGYYRLTQNASGSQSPETYPAAWAYQGQTLGEIAVGDVVGLTEQLNKKDDKTHHTSLGWVANKAELRGLAEAWGEFSIKDDDTISLQTGEVYFWDSTLDGTPDDNDLVIIMTGWSGTGGWRLKFKLEVGGSSLTPEQVAAIESIPTIAQTANSAQQTATSASQTATTASEAITVHERATTGAHTTPAITEPNPLATLGAAAGLTQSQINALVNTFLSTCINVNKMSVNDMMEEEMRLMMYKRVNGLPEFSGSARMVDIFAPPGVDALLANQTSWVDEKKTITGANDNGQLGRPGQMRWIGKGEFAQCRSVVEGLSGSATYERNRSIDCLSLLNSQDCAVMNALDPSRTYPAGTITGVSGDTGWTNNRIVLIGIGRLSTWWVSPYDGFTYFCYDISGSNTYWIRTGQYPTRYFSITTTTHPTLIGRLQAKTDWATSPYTVQSDDEPTVHMNRFYDSVNRCLYERVQQTPAIWEKKTYI